jgi:hypothetical protein
MAAQPQAPRLWRHLPRGRLQSFYVPASSVEESTFGLKAPVVDFFDHDYIM